LNGRCADCEAVANLVLSLWMCYNGFKFSSHETTWPFVVPSLIRWLFVDSSSLKGCQSFTFLGISFIVQLVWYASVGRVCCGRGSGKMATALVGTWNNEL
jgi:hypothetical protein